MREQPHGAACTLLRKTAWLLHHGTAQAGSSLSPRQFWKAVAVPWVGIKPTRLLGEGVTACEWPWEQSRDAPTPWRCPGLSAIPAGQLRWVPVHHGTHSGLCLLPVIPELDPELGLGGAHGEPLTAAPRLPVPPQGSASWYRAGCCGSKCHSQKGTGGTCLLRRERGGVRKAIRVRLAAICPQAVPKGFTGPAPRPYQLQTFICLRASCPPSGGLLPAPAPAVTPSAALPRR